MLSRALAQARADLAQPPLSGLERLGLCIARYASSYNATTIAITEYLAFPAEAYVDRHDAPVSFDTRWLMNQSAVAARRNAGVFLIHLHEHNGKPWFSPVDMRTNRDVIRPMALVDQTLPTGAIVLSFDNVAGLLARSEGLLRLDVHEVPS